jgi:hypothetical protein
MAWAAGHGWPVAGWLAGSLLLAGSTVPAPFFFCPETPHKLTRCYSCICNLNIHVVAVQMCVSGHYAPQPRWSYATIWGAYDLWLFRGSRSRPQWKVVHYYCVPLVCRKFWFVSCATLTAMAVHDQLRELHEHRKRAFPLCHSLCHSPCHSPFVNPFLSLCLAVLLDMRKMFYKGKNCAGDCLCFGNHGSVWT